MNADKTSKHVEPLTAGKSQYEGEMMKVLITGGAGYIGSVLTRMLLESGFEVRILDRMFFGSDSLDGVKDEIEIVNEDIRRASPSVLDGVDAVVDMCAISNDPAGELDPVMTFDINYIARRRMAELAKIKGVSKYILASSASVYGFSKGGLLKETSNTNPLTTYAKANLMAEKAMLPLADDAFCVTALRQSTVYGLSYRMRFDLAVNNITLAFFKDKKVTMSGDGKQWRPFVHVKDTSDAFMRVLKSKPQKVNGQVFNVGEGSQNFQIVKLGALIAESIGMPFVHEFHGDVDRRSYRLDFSKINRVLGFKPRYTPKEGAREIYRALKEGSLKDALRMHTVDWYKFLQKTGKGI